MRDVVKNRSVPTRNTRRPRRRKRNLFLYYVLIISILIIVGVSLSLTVLFNVNEIVVVGNTVYDNQSIISNSLINIGDNLFRIDLEKSQDNIQKKMIYIDNVTLKRTFPDKVTINVSPSVEFADIFDGKQYLVISETGKVLEAWDSPKENLIIVTGAEPASSQIGEKLEFKDSFKDKLLKQLIENLDKLEFTNINAIDLTDNYNPVLIYDNRINIELGTQNDLEYKIKYAKKLVSDSISKNGQGTLFMRDNRTNEASFVEKGDLENKK